LVFYSNHDNSNPGNHTPDFILNAHRENLPFCTTTMKTPSLPLVNLIGGDSSQRIVFGFICACATLSMWISNTATALIDATIGVSSDRSKPGQKNCITIVTEDCLRL